VQSEATRLDAQLLVKRAELKEPAVRLKQAQRRLEQLQHREVGTTTTATHTGSWAEELFDEVFKDFGPVPRGQVLEHRFRLTNRARVKVHIASVRSSAGFLMATASQAELVPGESATIQVRLDTSRFVGARTALVYVTFDRPEAGEVVLQVRASARDSQEEGKQADAQKRLQDLERKLNDLLKEMDALKKQLGPPRPGGMGAAEKEADTIVVHTRRFALPIQVDLARDGRIRELILFSSHNEGQRWTQAARASPDAKSFTFDAPVDGIYWFTVCTVDADGKQTPENVHNTLPGVKVRVDTTSAP
jgi:hypothetical protein